MAEAYYEDAHIKIYNKDCRDMSEIEDNSVQCVVTSPPYWGLRKYSGEQELVWGGDPTCGHQETIPSPLPSVPKAGNKQRDYIENGRYIGKHRWQHDGTEHDALRFRGEHSIVGSEKNPAIHTGKKTDSSFCSLCGAWKGAYGLEPTPEMYIEHTIEILREIRRVLRKDGVVFWNIGDAYFGGGFGVSPGGTEDFAQRYPKQASNIGTAKHEDRQLLGSLKKKHHTLKPKDLCLIPFRLAIACQEDGWWVRSVIIWSKPNPMPESVTDRPTESHEYILMLTKNSRYYWDADAVREPISESYADDKRPHGVLRQRFYPNSKYVKAGMMEHDSSPFPTGERATGRNIRSVWEFPTQPYPEAHFAVFPEKLPEICIKVASKENDLILDPFLGAGTTAWVAKKLNRRCVGYEISKEYCDLAVKRNRQQVMELND